MLKVNKFIVLLMQKEENNYRRIILELILYLLPVEKFLDLMFGKMELKKH
jgi:hypothetical protein